MSKITRIDAGRRTLARATDALERRTVRLAQRLLRSRAPIVWLRATAGSGKTRLLEHLRPRLTERGYGLLDDPTPATLESELNSMKNGVPGSRPPAADRLSPHVHRRSAPLEAASLRAGRDAGRCGTLRRHRRHPHRGGRPDGRDRRLAVAGRCRTRRTRGFGSRAAAGISRARSAAGALRGRGRRAVRGGVDAAARGGARGTRPALRSARERGRRDARRGRVGALGAVGPASRSCRACARRARTAHAALRESHRSGARDCGPAECR